MATIETIGPAGCDYTTPQAWYDAHKGNITADANAPYIGEIQAGTYPALSMIASTTDATHYFHLRAASGHEFRGILDDPGPYASDTYAKIAGVRCTDPYTRFEHIGSNAKVATYGGGFSVAAGYVIVDSCVAQDFTGSGIGGGFNSLTPGTEAGRVFRDCVAARLEETDPGAGLSGFEISADNTSIYHCVAHRLTGAGTTYGYHVTGASVSGAVIRNSAVGTLTGPATASFLDSGTGSDIDYNAVTEAVLGDAGPNSQTSLVPATEWVGAGATGTDFHLAATTVKCKDNAGSLGGYSEAPTLDIDDQTIGPDIGIDWLMRTDPGTDTELGAWFRPLSEPVRLPPPWHTGGDVRPLYPGLVVVPNLATWFRPLSEPVRSPPRWPQGGAYYLTDPSTYPPPSEEGPATELGAWYTALSEPVRLPPRWPTGGAICPIVPDDWVGPIPSLSTWFRPLSEPVRLPPRWPAGDVIDPSIFRGRFCLDGRGKYRVFNGAEYRFYRSNSAPPQEGDAVWATSSTLPDTPADTFADGTWWISCTYFNGVLESGFLPLGDYGETYVRLDIVTDVVGSPPPGPNDWRLALAAGGVVRVLGWLYTGSSDAPDEWAIAYTTDGSDPPEDTPNVTLDQSGFLRVLDYSLPAQADATTVKVRLQTRRNDGTEAVPVWVYSEDSVIKTLAADALGPAAPEALDRHPGVV